MAQFSFDIPDSLTRQLSALENVDEIAPKVLNAGMDVLEPELKARAEQHKVTGEMAAYISRQPPKKTDGGHSILTRPRGTDSKGVRNMEKMAYLEYGTSHQRATPVIGPTIAASETKVVSAMEQVFNEEVGKE